MNEKTGEWVETVAELARVIPREDGTMGVSERWAYSLLKQIGYEKGAKGYHVPTILDQRQTADCGPLGIIKAERQIEKLAIEIEMLELARDKERGNLVSVAEVVEVVTGRESELLKLVKGWQESEGAAHPKLRAEICALADRLMDMMREPICFQTGGTR